MSYNSTIVRKKKTCVSCNEVSFIFSKGRCKRCASIDCARKPASDKPIKNGGPKKESGELNRWFADRRSELTGRCKHCGGVSCKKDDTWYKASIAHILPKRIFKSVSTHPKNFIELCFWGNSCHTNFDNFIIDIIDLNCFDEVIEKFLEIYPSIDPKERRFIPDSLMQYVNVDI